MRLLIKLSLYLFLFISATSCEKSNPEPITTDAEMIFGTYCGECGGDNCVKIFKLSNEGVWEDTNDNYPGGAFVGMQFNFVQLSNEKFELVKNFRDQFPTSILDETEDTFGCPDCYDQCGYYLEWLEDGVRSSWTIDTTKDDIPSYLHEFVDQLSANVNLL